MSEPVKIVSIFYTKPGLTRDANGEAIYYRFGCWVTVGAYAPYNQIGEKQVERIEWDEDNRLFNVFFLKGGFKTIPYLADTEITYEYITPEKKKNAK